MSRSTLARRVLTTLAATCLLSLTQPAFSQESDQNLQLAQAFGHLPVASEVEVSPGGKLLAWIDNSKPVQAIEVFDFNAGTRKFTSAAPPDVRLRSVYWTDDENLLIEGSTQYVEREGSVTTRHELFRVIAVNVPSGKAQILLHDRGFTRLTLGAALVSARTTKPGKAIFSNYDYSAAASRTQGATRIAEGRRQSGWTHNLYEVDVVSGKVSQLETGTNYTWRWIADQDGNALARSEWEPENQRYTVLLRTGRSWKQIYQSVGQPAPGLLQTALKDGALWLYGSLGGEEDTLWRLPIDGSGPQPAVEGRAVDYVVINRYSHDLERVVFLKEDEEDLWFVEGAKARQQGLSKSFGGQDLTIISRSSNDQQVVVRANPRSHPGVFYLVDYTKGSADIIAETYPLLTERALGKVEAITYKARDGYEVPAFVTTPANAQGVPPLVVLPHGGPASHDTHDFDYLAQFLAAKGYTVLQPQFRGSTGYGLAHENAGKRQWGRLMQDDVTDGVNHLIKEGKAQAGRVCIAGASYGGYAALAGAAFTPELYTCAISVNGVSNLPTMLRSDIATYGDDSNTATYWRAHIGPATSPDVINASPSRATDKITAKVLLLHAAGDSVVPVEQSRTMANAMPATNPATFIELPGEDHWLSYAPTRARVLLEMGKFLDQHLPINATAPAAD